MEVKTKESENGHIDEKRRQIRKKKNEPTNVKRTSEHRPDETQPNHEAEEKNCPADVLTGDQTAFGQPTALETRLEPFGVTIMMPSEIKKKTIAGENGEKRHQHRSSQMD